jgi:chaperone required for assembly of F1-ATPase
MADSAQLMAPKRFWKQATVAAADGGWQVALDGRPLKTQGGSAQVLPTLPLAEAMIAEWNAQGDRIDPQGFPLRDLADLAIDHVRPDRTAAIDRLMRYAESDTLCYRADPEEPLYHRQLQVWDPLLRDVEARLDIRFERVSGILHRPQPDTSLAALRDVLEAQTDFAMAALSGLAPLAASLVIALAALDPDADAASLFAAANLEEDWQAEQWGWEWTAEEARALRLAAFETMSRFAALARG